MDLKGIFKKDPVESREKESSGQRKPEVPDGLLKKCPKCKKGILAEAYGANHYICPKCGGYLRMPADERIRMLADRFEEWDLGLTNKNPLRLKGYPDRIRNLQETTGMDEAVITGLASINDHSVVLMVMDCYFLTATMGEVVGEKITRGVERATAQRLPVIIVCCSGGARMQEGIVSLMQMAKTAAALKRHQEAGLLYVSVLTDPTTGGVTASFAMLGDLILAEPEALIGFAGPRVIEQTIRQKLPKGFQRSEFLLEHGFVDAIVKREEMKETLSRILEFHKEKCFISGKACKTEPASLEAGGKARQKTAWERVQLARAKNRPVASDYIDQLFVDFWECHGDRQFGDDPAICGGLTWFHGHPVTVIGQMKGKDTKENVRRNFAMPRPEGYRKALRLMKQAEKFHRPVICFVDTPGAFCGMEAEERGQGEAIARNLYEMSDLKTPVLSIFIGEGSSGGALALAVADEVLMLENAIYSILSPEGFASILWKDAQKAEKAAKVMRLTAQDLYRLGIIEEIIPEPECYDVDHMEPVCSYLDGKIASFLEEKGNMETDTLVDGRYRRFRVL